MSGLPIGNPDVFLLECASTTKGCLSFLQLIFKRSCFLKHLVHVLGGTASVAHRQNHCGSTANNVTTGEDGWDVRLHLVIHDDGVLAAQLQTFHRLRNEWIWRYTYCHDSHVDVAGLDGSLDWHWRTATACIWFAKLHLLQTDLFHSTFLVGDSGV